MAIERGFQYIGEEVARKLVQHDTLAMVLRGKGDIKAAQAEQKKAEQLRGILGLIDERMAEDTAFFESLGIKQPTVPELVLFDKRTGQSTEGTQEIVPGVISTVATAILPGKEETNPVKKKPAEEKLEQVEVLRLRKTLIEGGLELKKMDLTSKEEKVAKAIFRVDESGNGYKNKTTLEVACDAAEGEEEGHSMRTSIPIVRRGVALKLSRIADKGYKTGKFNDLDRFYEWLREESPLIFRDKPISVLMKVALGQIKFQELLEMSKEKLSNDGTSSSGNGKQALAETGKPNNEEPHYKLSTPQVYLLTVALMGKSPAELEELGISLMDGSRKKLEDHINTLEESFKKAGADIRNRIKPEDGEVIKEVLRALASPETRIKVIKENSTAVNRIVIGSINKIGENGSPGLIGAH